MKCTLLPQSWIIPGNILIPAAAVFIALALSACGGSNAPAPIVTRTVTVSPSAKPSVKATHKAVLTQKPAAVAAAPALLVVSALYGGSAYSGIEPQYVQFSGDGGNVVAAISWSSWTATKATGTGTMNIQGCVPDCADGSETPTPAYLVLSDPVNGKFTAIAEYVNGRNDATMWPEIVDQADPPGAPFPARAAPAAASDPGYLNPVTLADALDGSLSGQHLGYTYQCVPAGTDQFTCTSDGGFEGTTEPFIGTATVSSDGATYTFVITSPQGDGL